MGLSNFQERVQKIEERRPTNAYNRCNAHNNIKNNALDGRLSIEKESQKVKASTPSARLRALLHDLLLQDPSRLSLCCNNRSSFVPNSTCSFTTSRLICKQKAVKVQHTSTGRNRKYNFLDWEFLGSLRNTAAASGDGRAGGAIDSFSYIEALIGWTKGRLAE
ncbi:hypothetical protein Fot_19554 [Forsythia ovata]|uniref:Uncharacterized protein n=1 Tax=Forsythia ovata TaxID=205694 RepID=A0ABD1VMZ5_9LAMI